MSKIICDCGLIPANHIHTEDGMIYRIEDTRVSDIWHPRLTSDTIDLLKIIIEKYNRKITLTN